MVHAAYTAAVTIAFALVAIVSYGSAIALTGLFVVAVCGPACWKRVRADFQRHERQR